MVNGAPIGGIRRGRSNSVLVRAGMRFVDENGLAQFIPTVAPPPSLPSSGPMSDTSMRGSHVEDNIYQRLSKFMCHMALLFQ